MPLDSPEEALSGMPDGLDQTVLGSCHFPQARSEVPDCLMMVTVDAHLIRLQERPQGRTGNQADAVRNFVVRIVVPVRNL